MVITLELRRARGDPGLEPSADLNEGSQEVEVSNGGRKTGRSCSSGPELEVMGFSGKGWRVTSNLNAD